MTPESKALSDAISIAERRAAKAQESRPDNTPAGRVTVPLNAWVVDELIAAAKGNA